MPLRLSLGGGGGMRSLTAGTLSIGRGQSNDWVMPDPDRHLSKTHCVISIEAGQWILTDLSTNGVYINGARQPTARDSRVVLTDGDEFRIGEYSFTAEDVAAAGRPGPLNAAALHDGGDPLDIDPLDDPLGAPMPRQDAGFSHPVRHVSAGPRAEDPFDREDNARHRRTDPEDDLFQGTKPTAEWQGPSHSDHVDAAHHAMPVRRIITPVDPSAIDFDALIGDLSDFGAPAPYSHVAAAQPAPLTSAPPPAAGMTPQAPRAPSTNPFDAFDQFFEDAAPATAAPPPALAPVLAPVARTVAAPAGRAVGATDEAPAPLAQAQAAAARSSVAQPGAVQPGAVQPGAPQPAPVAQAGPAPGSAEAMQAALLAFLEGAGASHMAASKDPEATLRATGKLFRVMTEGLRDVLMSRATIKGELQVEQTMIRASNNNPLKFSMTADDAVVTMLSPGRPSYMPPVTAAQEAFDDLKMHELAVMAGVQTALVSLLRRFDPDALEGRLTQGMLSSILPAARKARLWDSFRDIYKTIASEAEDDFQAVFGRAFAKAYNAQVSKELRKD